MIIRNGFRLIHLEWMVDIVRWGPRASTKRCLSPEQVKLEFLESKSGYESGGSCDRVSNLIWKESAESAPRVTATLWFHCLMSSAHLISCSPPFRVPFCVLLPISIKLDCRVTHSGSLISVCGSTPSCLFSITRSISFCSSGYCFLRIRRKP